MVVTQEFGQHFAQLLARLGAAREPPEAERRETGRAIRPTGTGVALRLAADVADLVRQVAGQAVVEVRHQGRFISALRVTVRHIFEWTIALPRIWCDVLAVLTLRPAVMSGAEAAPG
ncbi:GNAT family acetyltransferase, putative [Babesia ovata]|uniref:GNAT family acetyltransferase, putative n=1 Tax=Babesia ovata TaxID=189622 RepID=A0A2H6K8A1_9APIC|nr:GNAT family acetyltransferase, putative [Babesia ovata]GBE59210.1 GNAT family acetyltransferase, putative [Babesia ovata]